MMARPWARRLVFAGKLAVTLVLCGVLLGRADWADLSRSLQQADVLLLLLVGALMIASVTISAYKWRCLLRLHGVQRSFGQLHRYYFTAGFFNNFLPSSIGGDGYRIYRTLDANTSRSAPIAAVLLERLSGVLALLALGLVASLSIRTARSHDVVAETYLALGGAALLILLVAVVVTVVALRLGATRRLTARLRSSPKLAAIIDRVGDVRARPVAAIWALVGVSVLFHLHTIVWYALLLHALGGRIGIAELTVVLALTSTLGILPISINGIGVIDGAFVHLATHYGAGYELALTAMIVVRGYTLLISLIGAWFHLGERLLPTAAIGTDLPAREAPFQPGS